MTSTPATTDLKEMIAKQMFPSNPELRPLFPGFKEITNAAKINSIIKPAPIRPTSQAVVFFHGNRGNVTWYQSHLAHISTKYPNADVWVFDYPGFGKTPGVPCTSSILENCITFLKGIEKFYTSWIWVGESVGAAAITGLLALQTPGQFAYLPSKIILINTFTSIYDAALERPESKAFAPMIKMSGFEMPTLEWLKKIAKVAKGKYDFEIYASDQDEQLDPKHMKEVAWAVGVPLRIIQGSHTEYKW
jgi:pimeloyl-ACP methyl ester carboxylesterase